jgi:periplasmic protein TonB
MRTEDFLFADYEDILFENRNKRYGAYLLRKLYPRHLNEAFFITLLLFILLFAMPMICNRVNHSAVLVPVAIKPAEIFKVYLPPPPASLKPVTKVSPLEKTDNPKLVPIIKQDAEVKSVSPTTDNSVSIASVQGTDIGTQLTTGIISAPSIQETAKRATGALSWSTVMPAFPGGQNGLTKYLQNHLNYPSEAKENGIEGQVVIQFIVDEYGHISDIKILRDIGGGCADEAIRVIKGMPAWKPGEQNGQTVKVYYTLPISFQLSR